MNNLSHHYSQNSKLMVKFIVIIIPLTVLFDWLYDFNFIQVQMGLYLKACAVFYFSYYLLFRKIRGFSHKNVFIFFLILNVLYSLSSSGILENLYSSIRIIYWIFGALVVYQLVFYEWMRELSLRIMMIPTVFIASIFTFYLMSVSEEHQNASAYLLLWSLPLLLMLKQTKIVKLMEVLAVTAILITIKRGAIIALIVAIIIYLVGMLKTSKKVNSKSKIIFLGFISICFMSFIIYMNWGSVASRLDDTGGSGRDILYSGLLDHYFTGDFLNITFGYGLDSVRVFSKELFPATGADWQGVVAHSDWLQYMHDFGLLGIVFMLILHIKFIKLISFHKRIKSEIYPIIFMTYSIFFLTTIYSFILNTPNAIIFGFLIAIFSAETNKIKSQNLLV